MASFAPPVRFCYMLDSAATLPPDFPLDPPHRKDPLDWIDRAESDGASRANALAMFNVTYCGAATAAMVYDRRPIIDLFRAVAPERVLGLMDWRGYPPFFFTLRRATPPPRV
jgi:hypothetical protein